MFSFGLTFKAFDWVKTGGIAKMFYIIGSVQVVICLLGIPMCKSNLSTTPKTEAEIG